MYLSIKYWQWLINILPNRCLIITVGGIAVQRQLWTLDYGCQDGACLQLLNQTTDMQWAEQGTSVLSRLATVQPHLRYLPSLFCEGFKGTRNAAPHTSCQTLGSIDIATPQPFMGLSLKCSLGERSRVHPTEFPPSLAKLSMSRSLLLQSRLRQQQELNKVFPYLRREPLLSLSWGSCFEPSCSHLGTDRASVHHPWAGDRKVTQSAESQLKGTALAQPLIYPGPAEALGSTAQCSNILLILTFVTSWWVEKT